MTDVGNNVRGGAEPQEVDAWITLDTVLFDAARKQLQHHEQVVREQGESLYWRTAYAGAAILLVCSTMAGSRH
jgi:hypothetical protein